MDFQPNVIIRASAGTGKTHRLSGRYLQILWQGAPIDRILATTFTRKAAGEIFARILRRLAAATIDRQALQQLQESLGAPVTVEECHARLAEVSRNLHRVRVSTLDAHFGELARSLAFEIGLPADWEIVDEAELLALNGQALEEMLRAEGPGFARSLVHILGHGEAPRGINQMLLGSFGQFYEFFREGRFDNLEDWLSGLVSAARLNEIQRSMVMEDVRGVELPEHGSINTQHARAIALAEEQNWENFLQSGMIDAIAKRQTYYGKDLGDDVHAAFDPLIRHARAEVLSWFAIRAQKVLELFYAFDKHLDKLKRHSRKLTFSDLPKSLLDCAADQRFEFRMNGRIQHLLLDEFQDTSAGQWRVLSPLARQIVGDAEPSSSYFCVGDVKQAIYGWRGGTSDILDQMHQRLPGCSLETLDTNRRSAQQIIDLVNIVFQRMGRHNNLGVYDSVIREWSQNYPVHSTVNTEPGHVRIQTSPSAEDEVVFQRAADVVEDQLSAHPTLDVGILVRTNKRIPPIIAALKERGIAASEEGGNALTDAFAVRLILAGLRLVDHPGSTADAFLVAHSALGPAVGLSPNFTQRDASADDAVRKRVARFAKRVRTQLERNGIGALVTRWVTAIAPHVAGRERSRLWQLVDLAYEYQPRMRARLMPLVRFVGDRQVTDPTSNNVRVMTVHQAKGLEFDSVVLCDLDDSKLAGGSDGLCFSRHPDDYVPYRFLHRISGKLFDHMPTEVQALRQADLRWRLHDSLCNLYVAMTRARNELQLILRPRSGRTHLKSPSGLVTAALFSHPTLKPDSVVYDEGDPNWKALRAGETSGASPETASEREAQVRWAAKGEPETVNTVSPSRLEGGARVNLGHVFSAQRRESMAFGRLIHAWFEQIEWLDKASLDRQLPANRALSMAARLGIAAGSAKHAFSRFVQFGDSPATREILVEANYRDQINPWLAALGLDASQMLLEVRREQAIAHLDEKAHRLISGNIDRLILFRDANRPCSAEIIDYKTDPCGDSESEREQKRNFYAPQLTAYADAVATMFQLPRERIRTRLLLLNSDVILEVPLEDAQFTNQPIASPLSG